MKISCWFDYIEAFYAYAKYFHRVQNWIRKLWTLDHHLAAQLIHKNLIKLFNINTKIESYKMSVKNWKFCHLMALASNSFKTRKIALGRHHVIKLDQIFFFKKDHKIYKSFAKYNLVNHIYESPKSCFSSELLSIPDLYITCKIDKFETANYRFWWLMNMIHQILFRKSLIYFMIFVGKKFRWSLITWWRSRAIFLVLKELLASAIKWQNFQFFTNIL